MNTAAGSPLPLPLPLPHDILGGRYAVERLLGTDGCGEVMRATDTQRHQPVAIHRLAAGHPRYTQCLARFQRAAQVSGLVQETHIVAVKECIVETDGTAYLIVEYVDGSTLRDVLATAGTIPADDALRIARDLALALDALHRADIVHRDLSPAHILIAKDGTAKVTGLGEAQISRDSPILQLGAPQPGTRGYTSPEQEAGFGHIDGRSDLYSLGAVLSTMLTGAPSGARANLTPPLASLVTKLLERQPAFRYAQAADVLRDLDALINPPSADARTSEPSTPLPVPLPPPTVPAPIPNTPPSPPPTAREADPRPSAPPTPRLPAAPAQPQARPYPARPAPPQELPRPAFYPPPQYPNAPPAMPPGMNRYPPPRKPRRIGWIIGGVIFGFIILRSCSSHTVRIPATATARVFVTATATRSPATQTAVASQPTLWNDPKGRINLRLPPGWRAISTGSSAQDVITLLGPDGVFLMIRTSPTTQTIDADFQTLRASQSSALNRTFTQGPVTDVPIGGEPGKFMEFRAVSTTPSPTNQPATGVQWLVDHGGSRYSFLTNDTKSRRADCDAILASVVFPK